MNVGKDRWNRTAAVAVLCLMVAGCTDESSTGATGSSSVPGSSATAGAVAGTGSVVSGSAGSTTGQDVTDSLPPPLRPGVEIPAGQVEAAVAQLDGLIADMMAKSGVPGLATAVVYRGKVLYVKGFGVRKVGEAGKVDADTVFQLASMSKPVGATVIAHEVTKGTVDWTTPVTKNLPGFAVKDPAVTAQLTIGDLYAHRSGLPPHAGDLLEDLGYDRAEILHRLRYLPLQPFRTSYNYTNFGMTAAAESVAAAAGVDWATLSERDLYEPLGMTSTSSRFADYAASRDRAYTHVKQNGSWVAAIVRAPDEQSPAGGVSSSAKDMARWMIMVLGDGTVPGGPQIASSQALTPAITPQIISNPASAAAARAGFYGFGFDVSVQSSGRTQLSHSGAFSAGAGTNFLLSPLAGFGIVTLTNGTPVGAAEALNQEFADLAVYGHPQFPWWDLYSSALGRLGQPFGELAGQPAPSTPGPAASADNYVGRYRNDYVGVAEIAATGSEFTLALGPKRMSFPLRHWDGDTFVYLPSGESASPRSVSKVTFQRDAGGPATAIEIEFYAQDGMGTFTR